MKPIGVRIPDDVVEYYTQKAKEMGVTFGDRIRRVLEQHMDAEKRANAEG